VVSEELDELFEIADRLVVIAQGRISPSVGTAQATVEMIGEWMSGLWPQGSPHPGPLPEGEGGIQESRHAQA
jgi:general nucleoside transport system ATP-binding protein